MQNFLFFFQESGRNMFLQKTQEPGAERQEPGIPDRNVQLRHKTNSGENRWCVWSGSLPAPQTLETLEYSNKLYHKPFDNYNRDTLEDKNYLSCSINSYLMVVGLPWSCLGDHTTEQIPLT